MRLGLSFLILVALSLSAFAGSALRIQPEGDWKASRADVLKVLHSAAMPLWRTFPDRDLSVIKVVSQGGPIVLYRRGAGGEYTVKLSTGGTYWSQYAYQFSHEFCHILCNYKEGGSQNKWFEESLCEMASIYSLRCMAETWKTNPPYPNWKGYSKALQSYAQDLIDNTEVPQDMAAWYRKNWKVLANKADDRPRNRVLAVKLLPLFEREPKLWQAVGYLNRGERRKTQDFAGYLQSWYEQAPRRFGPRIVEISAILGVPIAQR